AGFTPIEPLIAAAAATPHEAECAGALMVYTSGTTGAPKGVHRPLPPPDFAGTPAFAADLHTLFGLGDAGVRYLSTAPLYHAAPHALCAASPRGGTRRGALPRRHQARDDRLVGTDPARVLLGQRRRRSDADRLDRGACAPRLRGPRAQGGRAHPRRGRPRAAR